MALRTPKALCHPDGELFVVWHEELDVYSIILCDDDVPPVPGIDITFRDKYPQDYEGLGWRPVRVQLPAPVVMEDRIHPYEGEDD